METKDDSIKAVRIKHLTKRLEFAKKLEILLFGSNSALKKALDAIQRRPLNGEESELIAELESKRSKAAEIFMRYVAVTEGALKNLQS